MIATRVPTTPLTRPYVAEEEAQAEGAVVCSGWLVQGPQVAAIERKCAAYVGARHAIATSSCTPTVVRLDPGVWPPRNEVMARLLAMGISTGCDVMAIHLQPYYRQRYGYLHL